METKAHTGSPTRGARQDTDARRQANGDGVRAPRNDVLLTFFKALADANRLTIVGLLAQRPHTVEQLAAILGVESPTVSHHLRRLARANLVEAKAEGYYSVYSLRLEYIQETARSLLGAETLPTLAAHADTDAYDRKVLDTFVAKDGTFLKIPAQRKKFLVLVRHTLEAFEPGRTYTEREMNEILSRYHEDTALLRRALVDEGFMDREGGGGRYWIVETAA